MGQSLSRAGAGQRDNVMPSRRFYHPSDSGDPHILSTASSSSAWFCVILVRLLYRDKKVILG